jgi:hypothetical protein
MDPLDQRRVRIAVIEVDEPAARRSRIDDLDVEERHQHVEPERALGNGSHAVEHLRDRARRCHRHAGHAHPTRLGHFGEELRGADRAHRRELYGNLATHQLGERRMHPARTLRRGTDELTQGLLRVAAVDVTHERRVDAVAEELAQPR